MSTFMPVPCFLFTSPGQRLRMAGKLYVFLGDTELLWWATLTLEPLKSLLSFAYVLQMLPLSFPSFLFSLTQSYLQYFVFWWPSQAFRGPFFFLSWVFPLQKKKKMFVYNLVFYICLDNLTQGKYNILHVLGYPCLTEVSLGHTNSVQQ